MVTIRTIHDGYPLADLHRDIGDEYTVILWHDPEVDLDSCVLSVNERCSRVTVDRSLRATAITIPVQAENPVVGSLICCNFSTSINEWELVDHDLDFSLSEDDW